MCASGVKVLGLVLGKIHEPENMSESRVTELNFKVFLEGRITLFTMRVFETVAKCFLVK